MIPKEHILASIKTETEICLHLAGKLSAEELEFRLIPSTRSTLELMRYLTYCGVGPLEAMMAGDWSLINPRVEAVASMDGSEFPARMQAQLEEIESILAKLSEEDLETRLATLPWGAKVPLGSALMDICLKFLTAYRMQLFLHCKGAGHEEISTSDCWLGQDPAPAATA